MIIQDTSTLIRIYDFNVPNDNNALNVSREMPLGLLSHWDDPNDPNVLNEIDQMNLSRLPRSESVWGLPCLPRETLLLFHWGNVSVRGEM